MALKPITRQEQIIAGKNLEPITRMEKFLKEYGGGSGGGSSVQSDWNQTDSSAADFIKHKPFGDMPTGGDTLTWDGNADGLVVLDLSALGTGIYYKISDATPSEADFTDAMMTLGSLTIPASIIGNFDGLLVGPDSMFMVVPSDNFHYDIGEGAAVDAAEKGIYLLIAAGVYVTSLTIPGYTGFPLITPVAEKYIPDTIQRVGDDVILNSSTAGSTKKFKLTVDDSGTITATEVT